MTAPRTERAPNPAAGEQLPPPMLPLPPVFPFAWAVAHGCDRYGLWQAFEVRGIRQRLRWLPPGRFWMGSPDGEPGRFDTETRHVVCLTQGFWIGDTVVTQELWLATVGGDNPARFKDSPNHPAEQVSWNDVTEVFLPALESAVPGLAARLPWEAEWEYACREAGCAKEAFSFGRDINTDQANFDGREPDCRGSEHVYRGRTVPVGAFAPNAIGLCEMHGGVLEWCQDWYARYRDSELEDPHGPDNPEGGAAERVLRGGSWISGARYCRSAHRFAYPPGYHYGFIGFRLARAAS